MNFEEVNKAGLVAASEALHEMENQIMPPKTVAIPENVTLEIRRLHLTLVAHAKQFEASRLAFGEYMRSTMKILNVPTDGSWDINDNATQFMEKK